MGIALVSGDRVRFRYRLGVVLSEALDGFWVLVRWDDGDLDAMGREELEKVND